MPELPDRDNLNAQLSAALALLFAEEGDRLVRLLGDPPDVRLVSPAYWIELEQRLIDKLKTELAEIFVLAADNQADEFSHDVNADEIRRSAEAWIEARAAQITAQLIERTRSVIRDAVETYYTEGQDTTALAAGFEVAFGPGRAEAIAVTTITEAGVVGEEAAILLFMQDTGQDVRRIWRIEASACPRCVELAGTDEDEWGLVAPGGPPLHPNCACWLEAVPVEYLSAA